MNRIVRAVKIQDQFFRRMIKGFYKRVRQCRAHIPAHALIRPVLEPVQGRQAGQVGIAINSALKGSFFIVS